jgi:hypothetical protein
MGKTGRAVVIEFHYYCPVCNKHGVSWGSMAGPANTPDDIKHAESINAPDERCPDCRKWMIPETKRRYTGGENDG